MKVELRFSVKLEGVWDEIWEDQDWEHAEPSDEKIVETIVLDEMVDLMIQPSAVWQVVRDGAVGHPLRLLVTAGHITGVFPAEVQI